MIGMGVYLIHEKTKPFLENSVLGFNNYVKYSHYMKKIKKAAFADLDKRFRTYFINSLSGFKSVNLIGTKSEKTGLNLSIVSSVIHLGANPALMGFIMRPVSVPRHTYENILKTGSYTFNHILPKFYKQAHQTSARYPEGISEFDAVGLTPEFSEDFHAPYVLESRIKIGMNFLEEVPIKLNDTILMIGEIAEVIYPEDCQLEDGFLDLGKAETVTCSGLDGYHTTGKLERLSYAKPDRPMEEI
jgi:flavin reductase (DIM6/NTAB) family NADH-FMN oxidoreductase RutF